MDFGKISQQTCFESVRIKRILGRVACFPVPVLKIRSVPALSSVPICSMSLVTQKAMSDFTCRAGYNEGSSTNLRTNTAANIQTLYNAQKVTEPQKSQNKKPTIELTKLSLPPTTEVYAARVFRRPTKSKSAVNWCYPGEGSKMPPTETALVCQLCFKQTASKSSLLS